MPHSFHIPVLGLGYSVDTAIKVARFGISSVASIVDDELIERMRLHYYRQLKLPFEPIDKNAIDSRSRRITDYLNVMGHIVSNQFEQMKSQPLGKGHEIDRYFSLLPATSPLKSAFKNVCEMDNGAERIAAEKALKARMVPGSIDVNIMSKVDKLNRGSDGRDLGPEFTDALAALRGFAKSRLRSSIVLSAGMNPKLYSYLERFDDFFPDHNGDFVKKVILKVSDFRSAFVQAKFLAKKSIWVSEFRIESGLNCGGHAFATEGFLLGPVLEEFKKNRTEMRASLFLQCNQGWKSKGIETAQIPQQQITVQGGIGTAAENAFLLSHYELDSTGWGSPFLLVPEATNVDTQTLNELSAATHDDFYTSNASPLGVAFNQFRKSSAEYQRMDRIEKGRPGSPCNKKFLVSNTEFTTEPICTASRQYQNLKIKQLKSIRPVPADLEERIAAVTEKLCLCDGLSTAALIKNQLIKPKENEAVAICPGPNIAWFSGPYSLDQMVSHIYGETDLLAGISRPHMFVNELKLYVEFIENESKKQATEQKKRNWNAFAEQLLDGISYYRALIAGEGAEWFDKATSNELDYFESRIRSLSFASEPVYHSQAQ